MRRRRRRMFYIFHLWSSENLHIVYRHAFLNQDTTYRTLLAFLAARAAANHKTRHHKNCISRKQMISKFKWNYQNLANHNINQNVFGFYLQRTWCLHGSRTTLIGSSKQTLQRIFSWKFQVLNRYLPSMVALLNTQNLGGKKKVEMYYVLKLFVLLLAISGDICLLTQRSL